MFGNIGPMQLLIVLAIIVLLFGTKKLRNLGSDLGGAVKGFKDSMRDGEKDQDQKKVEDSRETMDQPAGEKSEDRDKV